MSLIARVWQSWEVLGWQICLAVLLTAASASAVIMEIPAVQWVQWFGVVGGIISYFAIRLTPRIGVGLPLIVGLIANVASLTLVFFALGKVVTYFRHRPANEQ